MTKREFLDALASGLSGLSKKELEERLCFYDELIDDKIEEGLSEENAVLSIGPVDKIIEEFYQSNKNEKAQKKKKRKLKAWHIAVIAVGSPIWAPLLISAIAVIASLYVSLWAIVVSVWSVFASLAASSLWGIALSVIDMIGGDVLVGVALIGASLVCAGLSVFVFIGCMKLTKLSIKILLKFISCIKPCVRREEEEK